MKKVFISIFLCLVLLTGCGNTVSPYGETTESTYISNEYAFNDTTTVSYDILSCDNADGYDASVSESEVATTELSSVEQTTAAEQIPVTSQVPVTSQAPQITSQGEMRGVWLSYYEIDVDNSCNTRETYAAYINSLLDLFAPYGITDVFAHVRAYADAMYKSSVYPVSSYAAGEQGGELPFDCLEIICEVAAKRNIKVHAWVNPYRVYNGTDINELSDDNKAKQWYKEGSSDDVVIVGEKIYFNPASEKARQLVVEGARELVYNYPIAGVHIDDYFYPPDCGNFDAAQYSAYVASGGTLGLDDWRRDNVNKLIKELYNTVKSAGADKIFSISPAGNINNNYNSLYADVSRWCKGGYADMIIPQIYFGFEHSTQAFDSCTQQWLSLKGQGVTMPIGLGLYKAGTEDAYAGNGSQEWLTSSNIIARQVQYLRSINSDGFVIFSCQFFDGSDSAKKAELDNLRAYLAS